MNVGPDPQTGRRGFRIALSGGPGGGKTTAADLFRRELGDGVVVVPEAATLLFSGGFPRRSDSGSARAAQRAIFAVQRELEETQTSAYPGRILLCDRGTIDGAAYWPADDGGVAGFFAANGSTLDAELARYDAVVFFETAAAGGISIEGGNPVRNEDQAEAARHRCYTLVPHNPSFFKKITAGLATIQAIVHELRATHDPER
jgi:predicted ATPase